MSLASRLQRLTPALSPRQRILMAIRARNKGEKPEAALMRNRTGAEGREYNQYVALCIAANLQLGPIVQALWTRVQGLEAAMYPLRLNIEAAAAVEKHEGWEPQPASRAWRENADDLTVPAFLRGVAEEQ